MVFEELSICSFLGALDIGGDCLARLTGDWTEIIHREGDPAPGLPFGLTLGSPNMGGQPFNDFVVGPNDQLAFSADPDAALGPALEWLERNPALGTSFPAAEMVRRWMALRADLKDSR